MAARRSCWSECRSRKVNRIVRKLGHFCRPFGEVPTELMDKAVYQKHSLPFEKIKGNRPSLNPWLSAETQHGSFHECPQTLGELGSACNGRIKAVKSGLLCRRHQLAHVRSCCARAALSEPSTVDSLPGSRGFESGSVRHIDRGLRDFFAERLADCK
jgi:hypothetical protein